MNCDHVFEVLTRGPFPTNSPVDASVEEHLVGCAECREMAEALRPAVNLFHESLSTEESDSLPGYEGQLPLLDRVVTAVLEADVAQVAAPPVAARSGQSVGRKSTLFAVLATMALSGFAVGMWCSSMIDRSANQGPQLSLNSPNHPFLSLASLNPPAVCFPESERTEINVLNLKVTCCRNCHVLPSKDFKLEQRPPVESLAAVVDSCSTCHRQ